MDDILGVVQQCLDRDEGWLDLSRQTLAGVAYESGTVETSAVFQRQAMEAAAAEQYERASDLQRLAVNEASESATRGWLQEQLATYIHPFDSLRSQQTLAGAVKANPRVLRPLNGVSYKRVAAGIDQAANSADYLQRTFLSSDEFVLGMHDLADRLRLSEPQSALFEDAVEELGFVLGFLAQRPERDTGRGPDVLWSLGELQYFVIECKSEAVSTVWKRDAAQLSHSMNWFREEYDGSCVATPIMFHHDGVHAKDAVPHAETRIVDDSSLGSLRESLRHLGTSMATRDSFCEVASLRDVLQHLGLLRSEWLPRYSTKTR